MYDYVVVCTGNKNKTSTQAPPLHCSFPNLIIIMMAKYVLSSCTISFFLTVSFV